MGANEYGNSFKKIELVWIDARVNEKDNKDYRDKIKKFMKIKFSSFEKVKEGIEYLKTIEFIPTYILCSGRLYPEFIKIFKTQINEFSICPRIIIFCGNKKDYLKKNKDNLDLCLNHKFYNSGGVQDLFKDVKAFLLKKESETIRKSLFEIFNTYEDKYCFEYINNENQLILPLFFPKYLKKPEEVLIKEFNIFIYEYYSHIDEINTLFAQLIEAENIPYEILYKYWIKALSYESNFFKNINQELNSNNSYHYSVFIQCLYEGFKTNKIELEIDNEDYLYDYISLSKDKIDNMNLILSKKTNENLPSILIYSKSFLVFNINKKKEYLKVDKNYKVLLIITNAKENFKYCNGYTPLGKYNENKKRQVLIFPFVFFEIQKIKKTKDIDVIYLKCLGEYQKLFDKEDDFLPERIPEDSSVKKTIFNMDLIEEKYVDIYNIITMEYKIDSLNQKFQLFGKKFVDNNKDKCYILCNKEKLEIKEEYSVEDLNIDKNEFKIKLGGLNKIQDISHIFNGSKELISLPNISKINTDKIMNMSCMFKLCSNLKLLSDISKWNTSNVIDMSYLFSKCSSLTKLPDISKWDTSSVTNMSYIFESCISLEKLPEISRWKLDKVTDMSFMFYDLTNLIKMPEISKWNTSSVENMSSLFENCLKLVSLPDISKWITKNVIDMRKMFFSCKSLDSLPDISKWYIKQDTNVQCMFNGLKETIIIPEKFIKK